MLILTRKPNESIRIGDDVTVTVLEVKGTSVHLGIDAPKMIPVHREEIYERIKRELLGSDDDAQERDELRKMVTDQPDDAKDS